MSLENLLAIKRLVKHEATLTECIVQAEPMIRRVREMGLGT
jgi:hypothetical protein